MDLSIPQLRTFMVTAQRLDYSRAAEDLHLSQPAVRTQIRNLETATDTVLFERVGRRLELTSSGRQLYHYAERILSLQKEIHATLSDPIDRCQGVLNLAASDVLGVSIIPGLLTRLRTQYPQIQVRLHICYRTDVAQRVAEGRADLGLIAGPSPDNRLESRTFMEDELVLVVSPTHRWAGRGSIESHELLEEPFLLRESGSTTRALVDGWLGAAGIGLNVVAETNSNEAMARSVELGAAVSLISKYAVAVALETGRLRQVPIAGVSLIRPLTLLTRKSRYAGPTARAFLGVLTEVELEASQWSRGDSYRPLRGDFIDDLLAGRFGSLEEISARAAYFGYDLSAMSQVAILEIDDSVDSSTKRDEAAAAGIRRRMLDVVGQLVEGKGKGGNGTWVARGERIVVLLASPSDDAPESGLRQLVETLTEHVRLRVPEVRISIGVGRFCASPCDLPASFTDAQAAVRLIKTLGRQGIVLWADDLGPYQPVLRGSSRYELDNVVQEVLGPLKQYDAIHQTSLLETLVTYFQLNRNLRATSKVLYIHVNTALYRLEKVETLLGIDMDDLDDQFKIQLALKIHQLLG